MPDSSILGSKIGKTGDLLRKSASSQIADYQQRFFKVSRLYDLLFKDLIVDNFDSKLASATAKKLFNKDIANFVAIDGTEYSKLMFDMIIFYAGACSCEGTINFSNQSRNNNNGNNKLEVKFQNRFLDKGKDISSCVPIYVNKVPEIDQTFFDLTQGQVNVMKPLTEEAILNNSNIANFLMTFAELYLAYKFAASQKYDIIFLDRSLSNMYSSLIYDTSCRRIWDTNCSILNYTIDDIPVDVNDLTLARHYIINETLNLPPARGDYLRYAILFSLIKQRQQIKTTEDDSIGFSFESICNQLELDINDLKKTLRVQKYIKKSVEEKLIEESSNGKYRIANRYKSTWNRIKKLVSIIGEQIFVHHEDDEDGNPFIIKKGSSMKEQWITTLDLAFLTLFTLYMLIEECWKNNVLIIGITKDTTTHEFKNHVIPICIRNNLWLTNIKLTQEELDNIPNTDRMLLQSISLSNSDKISIPWSLVEYDAAFAMAIPDFRNRRGYVSGAIKNKITPSQFFLRSFVQLEKSKHDSMLRSNVLAIDRLVYPTFDLPSADDANTNNPAKRTVELIHEYGSNEPIKFIFFNNNKVNNPIQNLVLNILSNMSCPSIPDGFGHNKALYIADKVAKWHNEQFRNIVDSTSTLILSDKSLRNFLFYMNTFRERREILESSRRRRTTNW